MSESSTDSGSEATAEGDTGGDSDDSDQDVTPLPLFFFVFPTSPVCFAQTYDWGTFDKRPSQHGGNDEQRKYYNSELRVMMIKSFGAVRVDLKPGSLVRV